MCNGMQSSRLTRLCEEGPPFELDLGTQCDAMCSSPDSNPLESALSMGPNKVYLVDLISGGHLGSSVWVFGALGHPNTAYVVAPGVNVTPPGAEMVTSVTSGLRYTGYTLFRGASGSTERAKRTKS